MFQPLVAQASAIHLSSEQTFVLLIVAGALLVPIIALMAGAWRSVRLAEIEASLKQQMLEKGFAPADMERVLKAGQHSDEKAQADDTPRDIPGLVRFLAEHAVEGADIERILRVIPIEPLNGIAPGSDTAARAAFRERVAIVKHMVESAMDVDDIERVLRVHQPGPCDGTGLAEPAAPGV